MCATFPLALSIVRENKISCRYQKEKLGTETWRNFAEVIVLWHRGNPEGRSLVLTEVGRGEKKSLPVLLFHICSKTLLWMFKFYAESSLSYNIDLGYFRKTRWYLNTRDYWMFSYSSGFFALSAFVLFASSSKTFSSLSSWNEIRLPCSRTSWEKNERGKNTGDSEKEHRKVEQIG